MLERSGIVDRTGRNGDRLLANKRERRATGAFRTAFELLIVVNSKNDGENPAKKVSVGEKRA